MAKISGRRKAEWTATLAVIAFAVSVSLVAVWQTPATAGIADEALGPAGRDAPLVARNSVSGPGVGGVPRVGLEEVARFAAPVVLLAVPGDDALWVGERAGRVLRVDFDDRSANDVVLDISDEVVVGARGGLLGMAASRRWLYVHFTSAAVGGAGGLVSRVVAFGRSGTALNAERVEVLAQAQPYANNNGGDLAIGPDGNLYVALGDGGGPSDPDGNAQDPKTWLGGLLRIAPTPGAVRSYSLPGNNPFVSGCDGADEVFVHGARNPWRFTFDSMTGDLWLADAGGSRREEINVLRAGRIGGSNLGWPLREGTFTHSADPLPVGLVDPVWEYNNPDDGCAVIGGRVYRGHRNPRLWGMYVFGDYCESRLWALRDGPEGAQFVDLNVEVPAGDLASFGVGNDGELYVLSLAGPVYRVVHLPGRHRFSSPATFEVQENRIAVGTVAATDDTENTLPSYRVSGGADQSLFQIDAGGRLAFRAAPDFERPSDQDLDNVYEVDVTAEAVPAHPDVDATQSVTVTVTDKDAEAPSAPIAEVTDRTTTLATLVWTEPANRGPDVIGYDLEFRPEGGTWRSAPHTGTSRIATVSGLITGTDYEFHVRARNGEGISGWSNPPARTAAPVDNALPRFTSAAEVSTAENSVQILALTAVDDDGDAITGFEIDSNSADAAFFALDPRTAQLSFVQSPNYEVPRDTGADNTYTVSITATSGHLSRERTATGTVTATITDTAEAPDAPLTPSVSDAVDSLSLTWRPPSNRGPNISDYDVQYKTASESVRRVWGHSSNTQSATITGLKKVTSFDVQVRARNDEGVGNWSPVASAATSPIAFRQLMTGLVQLVDMIFVEGDTMAWTAERDGYVKRVNLTNGTVVETVLDIRSETRRLYDTGLLGIEIDDNWLYVHYTDLNNDNRIDAFARDGTGIDTSRRYNILTQAEGSTQHFGGQIVFGPDDHLYIGLGDRFHSQNGQDTSTIAASIVRIDPQPGQTPAYTVPADNPFVPAAGQQATAATEIYLYGIKNPWRFSFDRANGDLWTVDNGAGVGNEEVNHLPSASGAGLGANLGWAAFEGTTSRTGNPPASHILPTYNFNTQQPTAFIGGRVYRGDAIDDLEGVYVFADYAQRRVFGLYRDSDDVVRVDDYSSSAAPQQNRQNRTIKSAARPVSFAQDADGELYLLSIGGRIFKIIPSGTS